MDDMILDRCALKQEINSLKQTISNQVKEKGSLLQTFNVFKKESKEKENKYMDKEISLEKKIKELDNIIYKVGQSAQTMHMLMKPQVFYDDTYKQALDVMNIMIHVDYVLANALPTDNKCLVHGNLEIERLEQKNDHLFELILSQDIVHICVNSLVSCNDYREMKQVEHARALRPLDSDLDSAYKIVQRIQEVLIYVKDTCPSLMKTSEKLVAVTPLNENKKVRMKSSTSASRSQPSGNTKNNRILQTTSSNMKNKVEDYHRRVKCLSSKSKVVVSKISNNSGSNQSWGSNVLDVPSTSLVDFRLSKLFCGIWTLDAPSICADIK
ncbi:hypothetical protein Tco_0925547 [Tanacetum coccineum]|uniref:Uncharacterized protein n=1 Tax=Tanacetum coccineum TaxID=301880 RepID=A0ABQ5D9Y9_9ASTR